MCKMLLQTKQKEFNVTKVQQLKQQKPPETTINSENPKTTWNARILQVTVGSLAVTASVVALAVLVGSLDCTLKARDALGQIKNNLTPFSSAEAMQNSLIQQFKNLMSANPQCEFIKIVPKCSTDIFQGQCSIQLSPF